MKKVSILFSSIDPCESEVVQKYDGPETQVDFSQMEAHYKNANPNVLQRVQEIRTYWETEGKRLLFTPKARITLMQRKTAVQICGQDILDRDERIERVAALVWSIGDALEIKSVEWMQQKKNMKGLLLDVTGSLCLYAMHSTLLDWIEKHIASPIGLSVIEEYYPGVDGCNSGIIGKIQEICKTEQWIGVRPYGEGMLYPKKSQCSIIMLGKGDPKPIKRYTPCNPCPKLCCLYRQLGGCHMNLTENIED